MGRSRCAQLITVALLVVFGHVPRGRAQEEGAGASPESGAADVERPAEASLAQTEPAGEAAAQTDHAGEPESGATGAQVSTQEPAAQPTTKARDDSVFVLLARDPYNQRHGREPDKGWIPIFKTRTELRFSGFIQLNIIHDFQNAGFPYGWFVPALISVPTDKTPNTEFDLRASRFVFETRTETEKAGTVSTLLSFDFFGNVSGPLAETFPYPRLRQAYVTWVGPKSQVAFTVGQAWATFLDLRVWPMVFDLQGPNAMSGARQGMVQASYAFGKEKSLVVAGSLEQPGTAVQDPVAYDGVGRGIKRAPDIAGRLTWSGAWGHLQGAVLLRVLAGESTAGTNRDAAFGNGVSLSGSFNIRRTLRAVGAPDTLGPRQDLIQYQAQGGCGTGRYIFDLSTAKAPQDAVYDEASGTLRPLCQIGGFMGYHHWWADMLHSQVVGSIEQVFNRPIQADDAYQRGLYVLANLAYRLFFRMDVGVEYYFGKLWDNDDASGHAHRLLFGANYGW